MTPRVPSFRWLLLAGLIVPPVLAADTPASTGIGVSVRDIFETRNSGATGGECRLFLNLTGDAVADAHTVRRIRVTRAEDMLGRDLVRPEGLAPSPMDGLMPNPSPADEQRRLEAVAAEVARRRDLRERAGATATQPMPVRQAPAIVPSLQPPSRVGFPVAAPAIVLRNPSRQSTAIKIVEGEIELFTPTTANGGLVRIDAVAARPAKFIEHEALKSADVRVMYLAPETYATRREEAGAAREDPNGPWSEDFANQMKLFARLGTTARNPVAIFFVDDPKHVLAGFELRSKDGRVLERGVFTSSHPHLRATNLDAPLTDDAQLVVQLATPGAVKTYPFKLENVPLP